MMTWKRRVGGVELKRCYHGVELAEALFSSLLFSPLLSSPLLFYSLLFSSLLFSSLLCSALSLSISPKQPMRSHQFEHAAYSDSLAQFAML